LACAQSVFGLDGSGWLASQFRRHSQRPHKLDKPHGLAVVGDVLPAEMGEPRVAR
jgi:hypothetical protein